MSSICLLSKGKALTGTLPIACDDHCLSTYCFKRINFLKSNKETAWHNLLLYINCMFHTEKKMFFIRLSFLYFIAPLFGNNCVAPLIPIKNNMPTTLKPLRLAKRLSDGILHELIQRWISSKKRMVLAKRPYSM